jgi:hypothetical protein
MTRCPGSEATVDQERAGATGVSARQFIKAPVPSYRHGKPIFWPQHCVRAAHEAMLKSRSSDLLTLARAALEAAIPTQNVLIELLSPNTTGMSAVVPRADFASAAGHAR